MFGFVSKGDWEHWIALEFMEGGDLSKFIKQHPFGLDSSTAFQLAQDILEGLVALHSIGIIHRDLKPANILLSSSNSQGSSLHAKITGEMPWFQSPIDLNSSDFGISKLNVPDTTMTGMLGTPLCIYIYISPESFECY